MSKVLLPTLIEDIFCSTPLLSYKMAIYCLYYYGLSKKIVDKKMRAIKVTGADIVVADWPRLAVPVY